MKMSVADALRAAKADIETNGWYHGPTLGYAWGATTATCAGVAVERACDTIDLHYGVAFKPLREVIGQEDVIRWNDAPGRTKEEVLAAFDRAIEIASEAQS